MIPTYVLTNNNHLWLLRGFTYLWNRYCGQPVTVVGFDQTIPLSRNFTWLSLGKQLPASQWSDGLLMMLDQIGHKHFILMLEDYWLYQSVDRQRINQVARLINDDILRIDLSGNRQNYKTAVQFAYNLVETFEGTPYQMSYQAAIWNKDNLRKVLRKGENPWQSEINGSKRVGKLRVIGTKAMWYQPVWRSKQRRWQTDKIRSEDLEHIKKQGWLNES